jgi:putative tricarboxylic transport membrane protein
MKKEIWSERLKSADMLLGIGTIGIALVALIQARDIFVPRFFSGVIGPDVFPISVAYALAVLGAALIVRTLRRPHYEIQKTEQPPRASKKTLLVLSALMALYLAAFEILGFSLSTFFFLAIMFSVLGERKIWKIALIAAITSALVMLIFGEWLNVNLPEGPFV